MAKIGEIVPGIEFDEETDLRDQPVWFEDTPHCVPPYTPMFAWVFMAPGNGCHRGMEYVAEKLSMPTHKGLIWRHRRGAGLMAMAIIKDKEEIKKREVKYREALRPYIENLEGLWKGFIDELLTIYKPLREFDLDTATNLELEEHFEDTVNMYRRQYEIHWLTLYPVMTSYVLFEDLCRELLGFDDRSREFQVLTSGFDNKSFQVDKMQWELAQDAMKRGLAEIILNNKAADVISKLEQSEAGMEWLKSFREFLDEHGWRMQRMAEINEPTWIEDPSGAIINIQAFLKKGGGFSLEENRVKRAEERVKLEKEILDRVPEEKRDWFQTLMKVAQKAGSIGEEHAIYCDLYSQALIRRCCLGIGRRFVQAGAIDEVDDIFFLNGEEVRNVVRVPEFHDLRHIVRKRRQDWEEWCKQPNPTMIARPDVDQQKATEILISSKDPAMLKIGMGHLPEVKPELKADLYGSGGSPGIAEGPARCIMSYEQLGDVQPGEILVAPATTPSWTIAFSLVKGVIVACGGSLAHAAIVGREYGIPVVMNVYDGINKIKTGQRIKIDGNLGTVYFLD